MAREEWLQWKKDLRLRTKEIRKERKAAKAKRKEKEARRKARKEAEKAAEASQAGSLGCFDKLLTLEIPGLGRLTHIVQND